MADRIFSSTSFFFFLFARSLLLALGQTVAPLSSLLSPLSPLAKEMVYPKTKFSMCVEEICGDWLNELKKGSSQIDQVVIFGIGKSFILENVSKIDSRSLTQCSSFTTFLFFHLFYRNTCVCSTDYFGLARAWSSSLDSSRWCFFMQRSRDCSCYSCECSRIAQAALDQKRGFWDASFSKDG